MVSLVYARARITWKELGIEPQAAIIDAVFSPPLDKKIAMRI